MKQSIYIATLLSTSLTQTQQPPTSPTRSQTLFSFPYTHVFNATRTETKLYPPQSLEHRVVFDHLHLSTTITTTTTTSQKHWTKQC